MKSTLTDTAFLRILLASILGRVAQMKKRIMKNRQLYFVVLIPVAFIIIFKYVPMYGVQIAFKDYNVREGLLGSPWVGLKYFMMFFNSPMLPRILKNTITISFYELLVGFPFPILLALALNEVRNGYYKRMVQMVTYAPHFISTVVMVSIILQLIDPRIGIINHFIVALGGQAVNFMAKADLFSSIYVWTNIWQHMGIGSVIYIAALSGIDPQLYDAARADGATRFQKIRHIDIPGIMPTIVILLILAVGDITNVGFEKIFLMQNDLNLRASEIIATYVYKVGMLDANYSFSTAIGLFNSIVNFILLMTVNSIAKKVGETSLW